MTDTFGDVPIPPAHERQGNPALTDAATEAALAIRMLTMRANKMTYKQIADQLGYSDASNARTALMRALDRHEAENVVQLRSLENLAMDSDERRLATLIANPDVPPADLTRAIDTRTRLRARRARMNGLDAPVKVELSAGAQAAMDAALQLAEQVLDVEVISDTTERLQG